MTEMKVDAIRNGSVIDHLPPGKAPEIIRLLRVSPGTPVLMGTNLPSEKLDKKDVLKIENHELSPEEVDTIALLTPEATLTIIEEFKIKSKRKVELPEEVQEIFTCPNPHCITNIEEAVTRFRINPGTPVKLTCGYCEKRYPADKLIV